MYNSYHRFNQSQKTEIDNTQLHDTIYKKLLKDYDFEIDRDTCAYNTTLGKSYQQADTDTILKIHSTIENKTVFRNVSEKTRNKYYNDIYMEIISVLSFNNDTNRYFFNKIGWALKNEELGPDYLSLLFLNKKENKYNSIFIKKYKYLKYKLFIENSFCKLIQTDDFLNLINDCIKEKPINQSSFSVHKNQLKLNNYLEKEFAKLELGNEFNTLVFALNKDYYTIGLTYSTSKLKELAEIKENSEYIPNLKSLSKLWNNIHLLLFHNFDRLT